jgi:hypothetical protein
MMRLKRSQTAALRMPYPFSNRPFSSLSSPAQICVNGIRNVGIDKHERLRELSDRARL